MADALGKKAEGLVEETKGRVKDAVGGLTGNAATQLGGKVDQLSGMAKQEFADLYDAHETKLEAATAFIQERPLVSLAIVTVVGLVIGRLFFGKR